MRISSVRACDVKLIDPSEAADVAGVSTPRCLQALNRLREAFSDEFDIVSHRRQTRQRNLGRKSHGNTAIADPYVSNVTCIAVVTTKFAKKTIT